MGRAHRKTQSRAEVIDGAVANLRGVRFEGLLSAQICSAPSLGKESYANAQSHRNYHLACRSLHRVFVKSANGDVPINYLECSFE